MTALPVENEPPVAPPETAAAAGRLWRLARKEMRETLRDRRTLVTLVLMPFLLYPLLSMVLRKFLITGMVAGAVPIYHVGFVSETDAAVLWQMIGQAREIMARRQNAEPIPDLKPFTVTDMDQALRDGEIDVAVRATRLPPAGDPGRASWEADCEIVRLQDSLTGERAARHVEDCFRVIGNVIVGSRLRAAGINQRPSPIRVVQRQTRGATSGGAVSLPALVPFVLILMTITGAVYPAIDLTAGERERGTLELLIAAPVPRLSLLFAKYVAVLTVAVLTASVNLVAMTGTILLSGLGPMFWGEGGITPITVGIVFLLLLLLAGFFAALLLTITSFARSFKEAQAYLIPIMLCSLGPGLISLMPGVTLHSWLAVTPLLNVALMSRDVLSGEGSLVMGIVVVASTVLYAFAALALAARLFAADAILYDARLGWDEIWRRPADSRPLGVGVALLCLACMFPISFAANGVVSGLAGTELSGKLVAMIIATVLVFAGVPLIFAAWRRAPLTGTFQLRRPPVIATLAATWLGLFLWPFAHELIVTSHELGLVSIDESQLQRASSLIDQLQNLPTWLVLLALAVAPAVCEEFCFRGLVFSAFRTRVGPWLAIFGSAALFGVFHLVATDALAVERLLPSTLLGVVLGWVCYRTGSVLPGMLLHAVHNGFLVLLFFYRKRLEAAGWGIEETSHLPWTWLAAAGGGAAIGWAVLYLGTRRRRASPHSATSSLGGEPVAEPPAL
ncbi:MAG: ABC transporter permease subunit/CPBP intramembrane protease [Pirellulaceae bacterium]